VSRLAVVPARGGSKRISGKNVRSFLGRPIIEYILRTAQESGLFDTIHVSTESTHIADVVAHLGFPAQFSRAENLADDHTPLMPVIRYVVETFASMGKRFDEIWLLMACAPLLEVADLVGAAKMFSDAGSDTPVLSVAEYPAPVEWAFRKEADGRLDPIQRGSFGIRSQDLRPAFYDTGAFCIFSEQTVLKSAAGGDMNYLGYTLPPHKAVDIDSEQDFRFAEMLFAAMKSPSLPKD
jgi:N-acylneuraminate cytidylyltransferase